MRIRSMKPEFWRSRATNRLSREHRLLWVGIWSYVDDNGVGINDHRQIASDLFPLDDDPNEVREFVREGLATLSRQGRTVFYTVDDKDFLYVVGWDEHQRIDKPNKARFPLPTGEVRLPTRDDVELRESVARMSRDARESSAPGTGEQGNRGTGEVERPSVSLAHPTVSDIEPKRQAKRSTASGYTAEFEKWWTLYPRKVDKHSAFKAFGTARKTTPLDVLVGAVGRYATESGDKDAEHVKHAKTWLNQKCWENYAPVAPVAPPTEVDAVAWLREEWLAARTGQIEKRTGLIYRRPDLPDDVSGREASERWAYDHVRQWITDNHEAIIARLTTRTAS